MWTLGIFLCSLIHNGLSAGVNLRVVEKHNGFLDFSNPAAGAGTGVP